MFKLLATLLLAASTASAASCTCDGVAYADADITGAINKGDSINPAPTSKLGAYPHVFQNKGGLPFPACATGNLLEYPLKSGTVWAAAPSNPPGGDRVIYLQDKTFCGCVTHEGAPTPQDYVACA